MRRSSILPILCAAIFHFPLARADVNFSAPDAIQPDANQWTTFIPDLANDPAPEWVKPGFQMAHEYLTATVPGAFQLYSAGDNGDFLDQTGAPLETPLGSAHGWAIATVAALQ